VKEISTSAPMHLLCHLLITVIHFALNPERFSHFDVLPFFSYYRDEEVIGDLRNPNQEQWQAFKVKLLLS
jgi:hypothetical protein